MNFVVIDVETANPDFSSTCQVGIAAFRDGVLHSSWESSGGAGEGPHCLLYFPHQDSFRAIFG